MRTKVQGNGQKPSVNNKVTVHYTGKLTNGKVFDSSVQRGKPFEFILGVGQVIKGWDVGVARMSIGEEADIICPPDYAYGSQGAGNIIPPNATLIFEVKLISFK